MKGESEDRRGRGKLFYLKPLLYSWDTTLFITSNVYKTTRDLRLIMKYESRLLIIADFYYLLYLEQLPEGEALIKLSSMYPKETNNGNMVETLRNMCTIWEEHTLSQRLNLSPSLEKTEVGFNVLKWTKTCILYHKYLTRSDVLNCFYENQYLRKDLEFLGVFAR